MKKTIIAIVLGGLLLGSVAYASTPTIDKVFKKVKAILAKVIITNQKLDTMNNNLYQIHWNTYITCQDSTEANGLNPDEYCYNPDEGESTGFKLGVQARTAFNK